MKTNPTLDAFEAELKKYMAVETEIAAIPSVYNIGGWPYKWQAAARHVQFAGMRVATAAVSSCADLVSAYDVA